MSDEPLILIADDEPEILELVRKALNKAGFRTVEAENGKEALDLYREHSPDLLVLDINMPEMDGDDVCRAIRKENEVVPIFFLTSNASEGDVLLGFEIGANDYIKKPFSQRELVALIKTLFKRTISSNRIEEKDTLDEPSINYDLPDDLIKHGLLGLSEKENRVYWGKQEYRLSKGLFSVLKLLIEKKGGLCRYDDIFNNYECFGADGGDEWKLRQRIRAIKVKLGRQDDDGFIVNEPGTGYRLGLCKGK